MKPVRFWNALSQTAPRAFYEKDISKSVASWLKSSSGTQATVFDKIA